MDRQRIVKIANEVLSNKSHYDFYGRAAELKSLINSAFGKNNPFYEAVDKLKMGALFADEQLEGLINGFVRSVENETISNVSYERKLKITVVNDYLTQAEDVLDGDEFHPAVAAFLIGASLEEFLRTWVEEQALDTDILKHSIDNYAIALKRRELIDKQDYKEITAWAGLRNDAAHGKWENVSDKEKIKMMLAGVNLFIKKYLQ